MYEKAFIKISYQKNVIQEKSSFETKKIVD